MPSGTSVKNNLPSGPEWEEFYRGRTGPEYEAYCKDRYAAFLHQIALRALCYDPGRFNSLELGAGTGTITTIIGKQFPHGRYLMLDTCEKMVKLAYERTDAAGLKVASHVEDILEADYTWFQPSVVHSHGVLEHFTDEQIVTITDRYAMYYQVHYVPGLYPEPSYGDERLLPLEHWVKLLRPSKVETFNDGLDYCLVIHPRDYH